MVSRVASGASRGPALSYGVSHEWIVRPAVEADLHRVSEMAAALVRMHHTLDRERFIMGERVREGYRWWLGKELANAGSVIVVAARGEEVGGYAYGRVDGPDWMRLLDAHGELHDIWVDEALRGSGVAERLVVGCVAELEARGAQRIVLATAWVNERARRFFERLGFRPTMVEMMRRPDQIGPPQ